MSPLETLHPAAALAVALLALLGAALALIGTIGLNRLESFYARVHAPTLGTSWGTAAIALAWTLLFSLLQGRLVLHALALAVLVTLTTPITLTILARAGLQRDRAEGLIPPDSPAALPVAQKPALAAETGAAPDAQG